MSHNFEDDLGPPPSSPPRLRRMNAITPSLRPGFMEQSFRPPSSSPRTSPSSHPNNDAEDLRIELENIARGHGGKKRRSKRRHSKRRQTKRRHSKRRRSNRRHSKRRR